MGLSIKTDKNNPDLYKVYSPSPKRSDPKIGTVTQGEDGKWYFVPTLGVHAFDVDELSGLSRFLVSMNKGLGKTLTAFSPPEQEYNEFVPRDPYDVD